ncbi:MAG: hypothetical protein ACLU0O_11035 [Collinsella sp.]
MEMSYSAESTVAQIALKENIGDEDVSLRISDDAQADNGNR